MKITVFGASGGIGKLLTLRALAQGHQVTAYVRKPDAFAANTKGLTMVLGSLDDQDKIELAIIGADAVISSLGPSMKSPRKSMATPIADGHRLIVKAMEKHGIKRFVTLATPSLQAEDDPNVFVTVLPRTMGKLLFPPAYREVVAMGTIIKQSKLDWTVVRIINPNVKHKKDGYGVWLGKGKAGMSVSRENVAACQLDCATKGLYSHQMPVVFNK